MAISSTVIMIFGGAGDLSWRKLIPSLFDLYQDGRMPRKFAIIAVDRLQFRDRQLRNRFLQGVNRFSRRGKTNALTHFLSPRAADELLARDGHEWRPIG